MKRAMNDVPRKVCQDGQYEILVDGIVSVYAVLRQVLT
jgi:hypothetical protein